MRTKEEMLRVNSLAKENPLVKWEYSEKFQSYLPVLKNDLKEEITISNISEEIYYPKTITA